MKHISFVFFHIGDIAQPQLLTNSIKKFNPSSKIYFITNHKTNDIYGVTKTVRFDFDENNLMTSRLHAFSSLTLNEPAIYIDTDVLIVRTIPITLFKKRDVMLCNRSFSRDGLINTSFKDMDLSEYEGKTFGEIYPFLACFTYTKNHYFWKECQKILLNLDKKFHFWYGDQEALRIIYKNNIFNIGLLDEKNICSLPEYSKPEDKVYSLHFKGSGRKKYMFEAAKYILSDKYLPK
jgi:hypothetical protein